MHEKMILLAPLKCTGCGDCVLACSMKKSGLNDPSLSRITVHVEEDLQGFYLPVTCYQCVEPPCLIVCPSQALYKDEKSATVLVRRDRCIGCKRCVAACPVGAMKFDELRSHAFKCDLCDGDPECVRSCKPGALAYVSVQDACASKGRKATRSFTRALRNRDVQDDASPDMTFSRSASLLVTSRRQLFMSFFKVNSACNGCLACVRNCPAHALRYVDCGSTRTLEHNMVSCARCGNCWRICPEGAIEFEHLLRGDWHEVVATRLVNCSICGAPLYTKDFQNTVVTILNQDIDPLCPSHKGAQSLRMWRRAVQSGESPEEISE